MMCVLYSTIFDRSPLGLSYRLGDVASGSSESQLWNVTEGWSLSNEDAAYLQQVAWDTVTEYRAQ